MKSRHKKVAALLYLAAAIVTAVFAGRFLLGSGVLNPDSKPFARAFSGAFLEYAKECVDENKDGVFSRKEYDAVKTMDLAEYKEKLAKSAWNPQWLSCFPNLAVLDCRECGIPALDLSSNLAMEQLLCSGNPLTQLDVSMLPELTTLICEGRNEEENYLESTRETKGLTRLALGNQPKLTELICRQNRLEILDVRGLTGLEVLDCSDNRISELPVGGLKELRTLVCGRNSYLQELVLENLPKLQETECDLGGLLSIRVEDCPALTKLSFSGNAVEQFLRKGTPLLQKIDCSYNRLTELDVRGLTELRELICSNNELQTLDITDNHKLTELDCGDNFFKSVDASGCPDLYLFPWETIEDYTGAIDYYLNRFYYSKEQK
ncbi:MAG: leucine-rich repeat domain-containing protein [Lachnospiraceae bacterium]|nr:leucine-rich repeat domain-containing protein [Lachnospiraceae bacterium]